MRRVDFISTSPLAREYFRLDNVLNLCSRLINGTSLALRVPPLGPLPTAKSDARGARQISRARGRVLVRVADMCGNRIGLGSKGCTGFGEHVIVSRPDHGYCTILVP